MLSKISQRLHYPGSHVIYYRAPASSRWLTIETPVSSKLKKKVWPDFDDEFYQTENLFPPDSFKKSGHQPFSFYSMPCQSWKCLLWWWKSAWPFGSFYFLIEIYFHQSRRCLRHFHSWKSVSGAVIGRLASQLILANLRVLTKPWDSEGSAVAESITS